jgi:hypothetical protein
MTARHTTLSRYHHDGRAGGTPATPIWNAASAAEAVDAERIMQLEARRRALGSAAAISGQASPGRSSTVIRKSSSRSAASWGHSRAPRDPSQGRLLDGHPTGGGHPLPICPLPAGRRTVCRLRAPGAENPTACRTPPLLAADGDFRRNAPRGMLGHVKNGITPVLTSPARCRVDFRRNAPLPGRCILVGLSRAEEVRLVWRPPDGSARVLLVGPFCRRAKRGVDPRLHPGPCAENLQHFVIGNTARDQRPSERVRRPSPGAD